MKAQSIRVSTKGGLIAAFECHKDSLYQTEITLVRQTGITKFWMPAMINCDLITHNKAINKLKAKVRKIPAKELLL